MDTLKDINISRNQIASFENTDFAAFTRLWVLDISANGIDKFPIELTKCQNLRELRLINNNISEVPAEFFDECLGLSQVTVGTVQHVAGLAS